MHYRLMTGSESQEYRKIRLESLKLFPESFGANYEEMKLKPKLLFEQHLEQKQAGTFVVGAYSYTNLVGIISFCDTNEYGLPNTGTFIQMYLKPEYQGKGLGLDLTKAALEQALILTNVNSVVLEVKLHNLAAIVTYQKAGFVPIEIPDKAKDLLVMVCPAMNK